MSYSAFIKKKLQALIDEMDHYHWLFTRNPEKDFSRIKKWSFGEILRFIISMEGKSLKDELLEHFNFSLDTISNVAVSVVGFSIVFGCNFYEKIVSGVKAVGTGQAEAARAQGFTANQTFFRILFPQALDHMAPNYESDVISLIQDTSVVGYIAVLDLTKMSDLIRGRTYEPFFPLIATALIYYLIIWLVTSLLRRVFRAFNNRNRKEEHVLEGLRPINPDQSPRG